jgi:hypothetical protein
MQNDYKLGPTGKTGTGGIDQGREMKQTRKEAKENDRITEDRNAETQKDRGKQKVRERNEPPGPLLNIAALSYLGARYQ